MLKTLALKPTENTFIDSLLAEVNFAKENIIYSGLYHNNVIYRSLLKFNTLGITSDCQVHKAVLKLYCVRNEDMEKEVVLNVHPLLEEWDAQDVTWNNQPSYNTQKKSSACLDWHYCDFVIWDITELVKEWVNDPQKNYGILIKVDDESENITLSGFYSNRESYFEGKPELIVSYSVVDSSLNTDEKASIAILTPQFFEWNGSRCLFGGAERYLIDLVKLLEKLNYRVDVFQPSNGEYWERNYAGITIRGIGAPGLEEDFLVGINKEFFRQTQDYTYHIYFNLDVAYPEVFSGSLCISHGVWWDAVERQWWRTREWYEKIFKILNSVELLVSVDTNTINWINAVKPEASCYKIYIPNYVDLKVFRPGRVRSRPKLRRRTRKLSDNIFDKQAINILYPRRLHPGRGWSVCKSVAVELVKEFRNVSFSFIGRGSEEAEKHMAILASKHPRIKYSWYEMDDMYKAYLEADIVVIPSLHSEGTSLSLLEAMACGKPVVAGLVGGLTDLIIQDFNGYLIEVTKENLKNAIIDLITKPRLRHRISYNARAVAERFSKDIWEQRWKELILRYFPQ